jgi:hypothetical protein
MKGDARHENIFVWHTSRTMFCEWISRLSRAGERRDP